jgi:hypothetical protein
LRHTEKLEPTRTMADQLAEQRMSALTINTEFAKSDTFTLEEVRDKLNAKIDEMTKLVEEMGQAMDKACVGGYLWSAEMKRIRAYYRGLEEQLETLLPNHYETNAEGKFVRASFVAIGLPAKEVD